MKMLILIALFFLGRPMAAEAQVIPFGMIRGVPMCSTGVVTGANVNVNGIVRAYATDGTRHYIGGDFTTVNSLPRQRFAAFDASWNLLPALDFNNSIYSLEISGTNLYAGGDFTAYGGFQSTYGAPVDISNGTLASTFPVVNGTVQVSVPDGSNGFYIGGNFLNVGGTSRPYAAHILANGTLDPNWLPAPNGQVYDILVDTDRVYLTGDFTTIRATTANRVVSVDKSTGAIVSNSFSVNNSVYSITKLGSDLAIGGIFSAVGNYKSTSLTRVSKSNAAYDASFLTGSGVNKVISDGSGGYYVGGSGTYGGKAYLAHVLSTGAIDSSFTANLNGTVNDIAIDPSTSPITVYAGGAFTTVNSVARYYLAALNGTTGADLNKDLKVSNVVSALTLNSGNLYVGGGFTQAGASLVRTGGSIAASGDASMINYPQIAGAVFTSIADGAGGWYVGGSFAKITDSTGSYTRNNIARIAADGTVDVTFNPNANGSVTALLLHADGLYVGGGYSNIGGAARGNLARLSPTTGVADAGFINPVLSSTVYSIAANAASSGSDIFVGGNFTTATASNVSRAYLAKFSSGGVLAAWNPGANAVVYSVARGPGTKVFVAGSFSTVASVALRGFAALDINDGVRDANFASLITAGGVYTMLFDPADNTLVLAGGFTRASHNGIAAFAVTATSMNVSAFAPIYSSVVYATNANSVLPGLAKSGNTLYLSAGYPDVRVGQRFMAFDLTQVNSKIWESQPFDSWVRSLALSGTKLFVGFNTITGVNGTPRLRLAAFDKTAGGLNTGFQADLGGYVIEENLQALAPRALEASESRLYVGGSFSKVGLVAKSYFAALVAGTGAIDASFPVTANNNVGCLDVADSAVYLGGAFTSVAVSGTNTARSYMAGFNESSGALLSSPNLTGNNLSGCAIRGDGTTLYFGGAYSTIGGVRRGSVAAIDLSANAVTTWDANAGAGTVNSLATDASGLVIGGSFSTIGGKLRNYLAGLSVSTGDALTADPTVNGTVNRVLANGTDLFVGGSFSTVNTLSRTWLAKLDTATANWDPYAAFTAKGSSGNNVNNFLLDGTTLYVGYSGSAFAQSGGTVFNRPGIVAMNASDGMITAFNANILYPAGTPSIRAMRKVGNALYLGGTFSGVGGANISFAGGYDVSTSTALNWAPNPTGTVNALGASATQMYVGGSFTAIGGTARTRLAKLDISDPNAITMSATWVTSANGIVRSLAFSPDANTLYAGGSFTQIGVTAESYLVGLSTTNAAITSWAASASGPVYSLLNQGTNVYAGGSFTFANSVSRPYLAAFDATGTLLSWNPNGGGNVYALSYGPEDNLIYVGGNFATIGAANRGNLGAVDLSGNVAPYTADTNGDVNAILNLNGKVYVGGGFTTLRGVSRNREGVTDRNGLVLVWNPSPNNTVYALGAYGADVVTTGDFTTLLGNAARVRVSQTNACVGP